jgi:hypothetical protein
MSATSDVFNQLAQTIIPMVAATAFPDTVNVVVTTPAVDTGGGRIKSGTTTLVSNVPCRYEPIQKFGWEKETAERIVTTQKYLLDMPTFHSGTRIDLDPNHHKLVVNARLNGATTVVPAITFTIDSIGNRSGVAYQIVVTKED